ncbi:MAG: IS4 family transposase [Planctomycetes bacterium]|nr:IS4 family transposase [Planctomycetota bacterium]
MISDSQSQATIREHVNNVNIDPNWSDLEFAGSDFQDARLTQRLLTLGAGFAAQPQAQIPQACGDWAATKGAYRFFENPKVEAAQILSPHQHCTWTRMEGHALIFAVQDTTYLNYSSHLTTEGLGLIGSHEDGAMGLIMHSTLALTPDGVPLGLLSQEIWARDEPDPDLDATERRRQRRECPIAEKESGKWLNAVRTTMATCPAGMNLVHVCDREADIYELFHEVKELGGKLLIRASHDRAVKDSGRMRQVLSQAPVRGCLKVEIPAQPSRAARTATVGVRHADLTLRPPYRAPSCQATLRPVSVSVVWVQEIDAPATVDEPLEWLLVMNVAIGSFEEAVERIRWYRLRWHIEVYHDVLKSGCAIEACRLDKASELIRYLTLKSVIAWRLFWVVQMNRAQPDAPCTEILAEHEWQALYVAIHRTTASPDTVPTVRQATRWIAQLGGFLGRTRDGEPGVTVIWRGWQRLHDLSTIWLVMHGASSG